MSVKSLAPQGDKQVPRFGQPRIGSNATDPLTGKTMQPAARGLGYFLLALSVISVVYPTWNPWTYPWLTNFWLYTGWEEF